MSTRLEQEFLVFRWKENHNTKILCSNGAWFPRKNSNDEDRMAVAEAAHRFHGSAYLKGKNQMKGEALYAALYQDLVDHESQWFDDILSNRYNMNVCDLLIVVLGTLSSIYRNRFEIERAEAVLAVDERVVEIYKLLALDRAFVDSFISDGHKVAENCHMLVYKYNAIRFAILTQKKWMGAIDQDVYEREASTYFRALVAHEIIYWPTMRGEDCFRHAVMYQHLHSGRDVTMKQLNKCSDADLIAVISAMQSEIGTDMVDPDFAKKAALKNCDHCSATEPTRSAFQVCGRCKSVHYCNRDCQVAGWKRHKDLCTKKQNVNK